MFNWTVYQGYTLRDVTFPEPGWAAFGPTGEMWFQAPTRELLRKEIDEALASVPPPVY